jgi:hypothetical protein
MADAQGARPYPYFTLFPAPLMSLCEMPVLELLLLCLNAAGLTKGDLLSGRWSRLAPTGAPQAATALSSSGP